MENPIFLKSVETDLPESERRIPKQTTILIMLLDFIFLDLQCHSKTPLNWFVLYQLAIFYGFQELRNKSLYIIFIA